MSNHRIGSTQAFTHQDDGSGCVGVSRFTCQEWDGTKVVANHSVEVHLRFDPETKKWEVCELKQWEGKF